MRISRSAESERHLAWFDSLTPDDRARTLDRLDTMLDELLAADRARMLQPKFDAAPLLDSETLLN